MKISNRILPRIMALTIALTAFNTLPALAGVDSGGGDGLDYRIRAAKALATEALSLANEQDMPLNDASQFFTQNKSKLQQELNNSNVVIRPKDEVIARVNGNFIPRKASTGFFPGSDILISREANTATSITELTVILLHEAGHHLA